MEDTGPASASPPKLPYAEKLTWDSTLKINNDDFVKELKEGTKFEERSQERQLDSVVAFPEPKIFAHFASKAYQNKKVDETREQFEERLQLPAGWKLLTTANNLAFLRTIKGYFGAVFWHPIRRRIVIAHRGTDPTNLDALRADLNGILRNRYVRQMRAACTLTHRIFVAVKECEEERRTHFEIYFTGHSLGAWLAQVTTFSLEYLTLEKETETFLKNPNPEGGRHAHAEVFDSPGSSETLRQMASDFDVRYSGKSSHSDHLDITVYLSSPNFVNCCNTHVGRLYRVYPKIESSDYVKYTLSSHSMDGILKLFNSSDPILMKEVVDWPTLDPTILQWKLWKIHKSILGKEYEDFFEWAKDLNYDPKPEDIALKVAASNDKKSPWFYFQKYLLKRETDADNDVKEDFVTIRYQTKPVRANQCSPSVFAESELTFLRKFQQLKILPNSIFDEGENKNKTIEKLRRLTLDDKSVICDCKADIRQLIPYVKTLLRLYPDLNERVELALTDFEVRKQNYRDITDSYRGKMEGLIEMLQKPDWPKLDEFLESKTQVCRISPEFGTDFAVVKALKTIRTKLANFQVFAFELQSLLSFEAFFNLTEFFIREKINQALILLECKSGSLSSSGNEQFVRGVIDRVRERPDLKLILITDKNEPFILNNDLERIIDGGITWDELTNETKKMIATKEVVVFHGDDRNKRSLEKLLRLTSTEMDLSQLADIVDAETLARFLRDEDVMVGKSLTKSGDIYVTRDFMYRGILKGEVFNDLTHGDVVAISGFNLEDLNSDVILSMKSKLLDGINRGEIKLIQSDQDFELLCSQNPTKNVLWLKYEHNLFIFHKTRGSLDLVRKHIDYAWMLNYDSDEELLEVVGKTLIISDVPGMGKSTVLPVLAQKIKLKYPDHWVVRVNLNDCTEALRTAIPIETVSDAARFLSEQILPSGKDTKLNSNFERKLFEQDLMIVGGVDLMFDGFDEISPDYEGTVIRLLELLQLTKMDLLVVTTRPHTKEKLEDSLFTLSRAMVPFSEENFKELLLKIWKNRDDLIVQEDDLEKFVDESKEFLENSIKDREKSFLGIPLHCVLLAEYLIDKFLKGEQRQLEVLPLFDLYEGFIQSKMNIYYEEKNVDTQGNVYAEGQKKSTGVLSRKFHRQCALKIILSGDTWVELDYPEMDDDLKEPTEKDVLKIGLMTSTGDNPQFLHRTIAEFFVLDYTLSLVENVTKNWKKLSVLSRAILLKPEFGVIRSFLESLIKNGNKSAETEIVLRSFVEFWSRNWSTNGAYCLTEDGGTVLHVLAEEHLESTFTLLLDIMADVCPTEIPSILSVATRKGTALHVALKNRNTNIALKMLQRIPDIKSGNENRSSLLDVPRETDSRNTSLPNWQNFINAEDIRRETALTIALFKGYLEIIRLLFEKSADLIVTTKMGSTLLGSASSLGHLEIVRFLVEMGADINAREKYKSTALGQASSEGHLEIVRYLHEQGADINACGENEPAPLLEASLSGHLDIVRFLIEKGADINGSGSNYASTALGEASSMGHLDIIRLLLENGADVNASVKYGSTPLGSASCRGRIEVARFILEQGADINASGEYGSIPLLEASCEGHLDMVRFLLEKGADINACERNGSTALGEATRKGHLEIVRFLVEMGVDINARVEYGSTPLLSASRRGHLEIVHFLLETGADINARGEYEQTPVGEASESGHLEIVRFLLDKGADINASGKKGLTPLGEASSAGHLETVRFLLEMGADVNARMKYGTTPLGEASSAGYLEVVRFLLEKGADINASESRSTPLGLASREGHLETVRLLLEKGADVNSGKWTPLHDASSAGRLSVAEFLISNGADVNLADEFLVTPLLEASTFPRVDTLLLLLQRGANIDSLDSNNYTPLHIATEQGYLETVRVLLEHGANPLIKSKFNETPLELAIRLNHTELIELLSHRERVISST